MGKRGHIMNYPYFPRKYGGGLGDQKKMKVGMGEKMWIGRQ